LCSRSICRSNRHCEWERSPTALCARQLLDNALKFTPEGGTINVTLRPTGESAELCVQDSGIGIPAEDLPHLFSRFHRGRNATAYPGSGLGLAIVRAIVASHGGQVTAENASPGARFCVSLPLAD
jgi:signal transduction histidine kinase